MLEQARQRCLVQGGAAISSVSPSVPHGVSERPARPLSRQGLLLQREDGVLASRLAFLGSSSTWHEAASTWLGLPQSLAHLAIKVIPHPRGSCRVYPARRAGRRGCGPGGVSGAWRSPHPSLEQPLVPQHCPVLLRGQGHAYPRGQTRGLRGGTFTQRDEGFSHKFPRESGKMPV